MKNKGLKMKIMASTVAIATVMGTALPSFMLPSYAVVPKNLKINGVKVENIDNKISATIDNDFDTTNNWATKCVRLTIDAVQNPESTMPNVGFDAVAYKFGENGEWQQENYKDYTQNVSGPIKVYVRDSIGIEYSYSFEDGVTTFDNAAPVVTLDIESCNEWSTNKKMTINVQDEISGVAKYSFDGGATWQDDNYKIFYENKDDIKIGVKDAAGNFFISDNYSISKIDNSAPIITSIEGNPVEYQRENQVTLKVTAYDVGSAEAGMGLIYSFDNGETWSFENESQPISENGTIHIKVKDFLENTVSQDVVVSKIDDVYALISQESEVWDSETNKSTVTVRSSNKELAESDEWKHPKLPGNTIQKDMYALVKVYDENGTYEDVEFTDNHGFSSKLNIIVNQIDDKAPIVNIEQIENENGTVTVVASANEDLVLIDGTEYSNPEDKTKIEVTFKRNVDLGEVTFSDIYGNETTENINVTGCRFVVLISEVDSGDGVALIKAKSVLPLKDIKPTWAFTNSKNMKKLYYKNGLYTTTFTNIYGETYDATFEVTGADFIVEKENVFNDDTNTVTVVVSSTHEFKDTKPTWTLSEDKHTYTKTFSENGADYLTTFEDVDGEKEEVRIQTTYVDDVAPVINITMDELDDGGVKVTATANEKCANIKPTWELSSDKKEFSKVYYKDGTYTTKFTDIHGNSTDFTFTVTGTEFVLTQNKSEADPVTGAVTITVQCNAGLKDTKPTWTLSEDGKTYSKVFQVGTQSNYNTTFENIYGETKIILIQF